MKLYLFFILSFLFFTSARAQTTPEPAAAVIQSAQEQAAREKKNVFLIFHASWCGWCHRMDTALNDPSIRTFFQDNYVFRHLVVYEHGENKRLENPGGLEVLRRLGGTEEGIPYWAVLDAKGTLLADSRIDGKPGKNTGCPASKEEVDYFIKVLEKTSKLGAGELSAIRTRFRKNEQ